MTRIIVIGDLHGKNAWRDIVRKETKADKVIFLGDYFDSFDIPFKQQYTVFKDIITYRYKYPTKAVLLTGNHDLHYLTGVTEHYSGYQKDNADIIRETLDQCVSAQLIQMAFVYENFLFTHAGVTRTWAKTNGIHGEHIDKKINKLFRENICPFLFTPDHASDRTGESICQPPTWVRPQALCSDLFQHYTQIIGHTHTKHVAKMAKGKVYLIDTMDYSKEYLIIDEGVISIGKA